MQVPCQVATSTDVSCAAAVAIAAWVIATMAPLFAALKMCGLLRVSAEAEDMGLDLALHGASCYPEGADAGGQQHILYKNSKHAYENVSPA